MTKDDAKMMIELLAQIVSSDKELQEFFIKEMIRATKGRLDKSLTLKEAAARLGKSSSWLYKNKNLFNYTKRGTSKSSCIMFDNLSFVKDSQKLFK